MATSIQSPLSYYLHVGEPLHKQNTAECLQEIAASVTIDRSANAKTVAQYNQYCASANDLTKRIRSKKTARNWGIAGIITAALILIIVFGCMDMMAAIKAMLIAFSIIAAIAAVMTATSSPSSVASGADAGASTGAACACVADAPR